MGPYQSQIKINMNFFNRNHYFLLHILVTEVETFSKHYNKVFFLVLPYIYIGYLNKFPPFCKRYHEYYIQ